MSSFNCCFLTNIQISQEADQVVWYSHLFKNFSQSVVIHPVKDFSLVNEAEVNVFMEFSCFFCDTAYAANLISCSFAFSKSSLNIWNFLIYVLLKHCLENFEHYFGSMWNHSSCEIVWAFSDITLLWDWIKIRTFPVLWPLHSFPNLPAHWL